MSTNVTILYLFFIFTCCNICVTVRGSENDGNEITNRGINMQNILEKITSTFMSRSGTGTSQVLSLNLSNLLILILLKTLIFTIGAIGAGGFHDKGYFHEQGHGHEHGRSTDSEDRFITDSEILLYLGYLSGSPGKYECLQNVACHTPEQASQYIKAGELLLKTARTVPSLVSFDSKIQEQTLRDLSKAIEFGLFGGNCDKEFLCTTNIKKKS